MDAVPDQSGNLGGPAAARPDAFVCPDCGKSYDTEFGLSYHRKVVHEIDTFAAVTDDRQALARIRNAVIAGFISGGLTGLLAVTGFLGFDAWSLIDAALILGLTVGVWNRNRGCAIALFVVWIIEKLFQIVQDPGSFVSLPIGIAFAVLFWQGISGTFAYHQAHAARMVDRA